MIELTEDNLQEYLSTNDKVIVQFGATWCGACKIMKPRVKKVAAENTDIVFIYADAEKHVESRSITPIQNLPTFLGFVNGKLVSKTTGSKIENVNNLIKEVNNI
tara:strand:- start:51 stop:362 length:312 start_codon:yes stop_codon:yes gene_type:complete